MHFFLMFKNEHLSKLLLYLIWFIGLLFNLLSMNEFKMFCEKPIFTKFCNSFGHVPFIL